ncbi:hypothetical protein PTKIN_Ptkin04bG0162000 [Pterospermum kingtungense]
MVAEGMVIGEDVGSVHDGSKGDSSAADFDKVAGEVGLDTGRGHKCLGDFPLEEVFISDATALYRDSSDLCIGGQRQHIISFLWVCMCLLIWAYKVIPSLAKECALLEQPVERPLCLWWDFPKKMKSFNYFFDQPVDALETLSPSTVEQEHLRLLKIDDDLSDGIQYVAPQKPINLKSSTPTSI